MGRVSRAPSEHTDRASSWPTTRLGHSPGAYPSPASRPARRGHTSRARLRTRLSPNPGACPSTAHSRLAAPSGPTPGASLRPSGRQPQPTTPTTSCYACRPLNSSARQSGDVQCS